ncbi:MAG: hypothetical protein N3H30_02480 [Candidatus Micrarchaeota archaeon]|nr:hypothetical protein [Candidatus Micrarchaeota archaeon]
MRKPLLSGICKPAMYFGILLLTLLLYMTGMIGWWVNAIGALGYIGAFINGIFYSYGLTTPLALAIFGVMSDTMDPLHLAAIGASGAIISDYLIFSFVRGMNGTIKVSDKHTIKVPRPKGALAKAVYMVVGGLTLISPFPDEMAAVILGLRRLDSFWFVSLVFISKFVGILMVSAVL